MTFIAVTPGEGGLNGRKPGAFYADAAPQLDATGPGCRKDGRRRKAVIGGPRTTFWSSTFLASTPAGPCATEYRGMLRILLPMLSLVIILAAKPSDRNARDPFERFPLSAMMAAYICSGPRKHCRLKAYVVKQVFCDMAASLRGEGGCSFPEDVGRVVQSKGF